MNNLQIFNFKENEVRVIERNDETWFCLKDVCDILDIKNATDVSKRLNQDGLTRYNLGGRSGETIFVNESNLYKTIFQSRKEEAEQFTEWVTGEVLPSIRKHGAYMNEQTLEQALTSPDFLIKLATSLKEEQEKRKQLEIQNSKLAVDNQIMAPKAEYFDELVDRNLLTSFRETAKELQIKEKEFISFLIYHKYIYRNKKNKLLPYANYKAEGLFEVKECINDKSSWKGQQTLITPKGRETFRLLLK